MIERRSYVRRRLSDPSRSKWHLGRTWRRNFVAVRWKHHSPRSLMFLRILGDSKPRAKANAAAPVVILVAIAANRDFHRPSRSVLSRAR